MKVVILYRPNSEHARLVEEFIHDYKYRHADTKLEVVNIDTREGASMASLYDIMQYPSIIVAKDDGSPQKIWQGDTLPLMNEVVSYAHL